VTGIACEENFDDYLKAQQLLKTVKDLSKKLEIKVSRKDLMDMGCSEFNIGEITGLKLDKESLDIKNAKQLNFWLRNRLSYNASKLKLEDDKKGLVEYDILLHQILTRNSLLSWNRFRLGKIKYCTYPVNTLAVFVHDVPIETENHPFPNLIKLVIDLYKETSDNFLNFKDFIEKSNLK
jgi:hypothetical protein